MNNGRGGKTNLYNIYMDGEICITGATARQVQEQTGCRSTDVAKYAKQGYYRNNGHTYKFVVTNVLTNKRPRTDKNAYRDKPIKMPPGWANEYDKWRMLALRALRSPAAVRRYRRKAAN
jgi:hypothetical protein